MGLVGFITYLYNSAGTTYGSYVYISCLVTINILRYSAKLSRGKAFLFFAVSEPPVKVVSAKFCGHAHILIGPEQSVKVFSAKFSVCTETQKFSPWKVFHHMVSLFYAE